MDLIGKVAEKLLFSLVSSIFLALAGISVMTGKFPPQKSDIVKLFNVTKGLYFSNAEYNKFAKNVNTLEPSLSQMVELQRLGLKRTELAFELSKIMVKFPQGVPSELLKERFDKISYHLDHAGIEIDEINIEVQKLHQEKLTKESTQ